MRPAFPGGVEVRACPHGRGVFATEDIAADEVIREFEDIAVSSRPIPGPEERYALRIGDDELWEGFPAGSPDYWSNFIDHSDDPNVVFVIDRRQKRAWLRAARTIRKGQEIFINYMDYHCSNPTYNG